MSSVLWSPTKEKEEETERKDTERENEEEFRRGKRKSNKSTLSSLIIFSVMKTNEEKL